MNRDLRDSQKTEEIRLKIITTTKISNNQNFQQVLTGVPVFIQHIFTGVPKYFFDDFILSIKSFDLEIQIWGGYH